MKFIHVIFGLIVAISILESVRADILDIALPTIFGTKDKKYRSCYDCINVVNAECNHIPPNSTSFVQTCDESATGCVKKIYIDDGYTVISRECYYGPVKFYRDFSCKGTKYTYAQEKCYLCTSDLCNGGKNLYTSVSLQCIWMLSALYIIRQVI